MIRSSTVRGALCVFMEMRLKKRNFKKKLKKCYSNLNILFDLNNIDRAHHIGLSYTDNQQEKKVKSIIVKFRPWEGCNFVIKVE